VGYLDAVKKDKQRLVKENWLTGDVIAAKLDDYESFAGKHSRLF
jgi:hypothetical protein